MAKIHIIIKVNLFTDTFLSDPYPRRIWAVPAPYVLHAEVPSDQRKYGFDTEQVIYPRTFTGHYQRSNIYTQEIIEQYEVKERPGNYLNLKFGLSIRLGKK